MEQGNYTAYMSEEGTFQGTEKSNRRYGRGMDISRDKETTQHIFQGQGHFRGQGNHTEDTAVAEIFQGTRQLHSGYCRERSGETGMQWELIMNHYEKN